MSFSPYLNFDGTCAEAFEWYQSIFGGELFVVGSGEEMPGADVPEGFEGRTIHASITLDNGGILMGSDTQPGGLPKPQGMYVAYTAPDVEVSSRIWGQISDGALDIEMDYEPTFFSPGFGCLTDKYGTPWMIDTAYPAEG